MPHLLVVIIINIKVCSWEPIVPEDDHPDSVIGDVVDRSSDEHHSARGRKEFPFHGMLLLRKAFKALCNKTGRQYAQTLSYEQKICPDTLI